MSEIIFSERLSDISKLLGEELKTVFDGCKKIAIKIHFGEPGNNNAFVPEQIKPVTEILRRLNIDFFLYDSSVAYSSPRNNPASHKKVAEEKGWGELGEIRTDNSFIKCKGKFLNYEVCKELAEADGVLVISHVKGHVCSGFGGAIKNLGMGALTKKSKRKIHAGGKPKIVGKCVRCKLCEKACPIDGIEVKNKPKFKKCYGCSDCIRSCPNKVLSPKVNYFDELLADGANTAQSKFKKVFYISYLQNISKDCDCEEFSGGKIAEDCGYLFGKDGVAIDKAAHDVIKNKMGRDVFLEQNKKSGLQQIESAEKLGMGSSEYEFINYPK